MSTRLDRLFLLLDTGSTAVIRKSAAEQLGQVQKLHSHELNYLLSKVHGFLGSSNWNTRIAAGQAVNAIARNVPQWQPPFATKKEEQEGPPPTNADQLQLAQFDIEKVLSHGASLLGSEGAEYDMQDEGMSLDQKERLTRQKQLLNKRLGLDVAGGLGLTTEELFKEEDLLVTQSEDQADRDRQQSCVKELLRQQLLRTHMSVRERNHAKRKAKQLAKQSSKELEPSGNSNDSFGEPTVKLRRSSSAVFEQQDQEKLLVDNAVDSVVKAEEVDEWPFEAFCQLLTNDLFSALWERRHGAATGLREVVKCHAGGAGKTAGLTHTQMEAANQLWLEDVAVRLICVLALDRFGDFVSDEVVAPVRETCAQCLGLCLRHMTPASVLQTWEVLRQLLVQRQWEVRHGGLLGLKYLLAVRQDMATSLLTLVVPVVMQGLQDGDDDVRAVAASALLPVTDQLVSLLPQYVGPITECLWFTLLDLDDLTASTNSIMSLLSSLLAKIEADTQCVNVSSLTDLMPRLWPFLTHNIASVRKAALETLHTLLSRPRNKDASEWLGPILADTMRHVLQRALLEEKKEITDIIVKVWRSILACCSGQQLVIVTAPYLGIWLCLMMQPSKIPFDPKMLIHAHHQPKQLTPSRVRHTNAADPPSQETLCYISGSKSGADSKDQGDLTVVRARVIAARLLAEVCSVCCKVPACGSDSPLDAITNMLVYHLASKAAVQRYAVALIITHCDTLLEPDVCPPVLLAKLCECLTDGLYYDEIALSFTRLQTQCHDFIRTLRLTDTYPHGCVLTLEQAQALCTSVYNEVRQQLPQSQWSECDDRRQQLLDLVNQTSSEQLVLQNRVQSCIAGVLIRLKKLPPTMNPVVRPLMDAVKKETNVELQTLAAENLARLITLCSSRTPCPNPKVIRNLCSMLCADPHTTPLVGTPVTTDPTIIPAGANSGRTAGTDCDVFNGILTLHTQHQLPVSSGRGRKPASLRRDVSIDTSLCDSLLSDDHPARTALQVQLRGMMLALTTIARHCGPDLPHTAPALWQALFTPLETYSSTNSVVMTEETDMTSAQQLVNSLQVLEVTMASFHSQLHPQLQSRLPQLISCLKHCYTAVRHLAARCLGNLGKILTADTMTCVIEIVLPLLDASNTPDIEREGAIEAMANVIEQLGVALVPYMVLLVVPLLGRMSDHNTAVRLMASQCFATLIRLIPLEAGIPNPPAMKNSLVEQKERDRRFIEQLLDGSKLEIYDILVPIKAELRKYQQDGVNWLAFLNKYKLHGILCDDMGLGKTLQSICILASDHRRQKLEYERTGDVPPLPSIVLCPPTLTGHWVYEVDKFVSPEYLHPLHYTGPPLERIKLRKLVKKHNLVVASYDVVRNDIDFFSTIRWNYCILDEGHIIKNSKTKLSRAVKQLNCRHRLILSGTPIQNNVLELWSLFDFLLPGFLGSEKQFQVRYGRPILASRDAKSSSKEQEAGALAMEALHRQVLPFILRRLKEDVLHDLPPKIIQDYYCDLSPLQMKLYEDFAKSRAKKSMEERLSEGEKKTVRTERAAKMKKETGTVCTHVFQALQYLRKVCDHPALVVTKQHPQYPQLMDDLRQQGTNLHDLQHAPKLIALKQLMTDCGIGVDLDDTETPVVNQHRALIFCQLKSMLDIVEKDLLKAHMSKVSYLRLDGSVPTANRHSIVTRFNNDPSIDLLLLTTHVGGLGLNLTGADTVIFVEHDWNPMKDLQAMDRAHRIGQKKVVNVYRLITRGTLEEKIMGLQKFKMNIANSVISADNSSLSSMATDQLLDLFSINENKTTTSAAQSEATMETQQNAQSVIEGLEELWDEKQYETEYDLGEFLSELKH